MRLVKYALALGIMCAVLLGTGCKSTLQPENQTYGIAMSIDRTDLGLIELGITTPTSKGESSGSGESQEGGYINFFAISHTYFEALDLLQTIVPYPLNLSQMRVIIISQEVAQEPGFKELTEEIMLTNELYGTTYALISLDRAKDVLMEERVQIGGRLTTEMDTALNHYSQEGYATLTRLSDLYYSNQSLLGNPLLSLMARVSDKTDKLVMPEDDIGAALPGKLPVEQKSKLEILGSAVMRDGAMIGTIDGEQTKTINMLKGKVSRLAFVVDSIPLHIVIAHKPKLSVDLSTDPIRLSIYLKVLPLPVNEMPSYDRLKECLQTDISLVMDHMISLGVDTVGFTSRAAAKFLTHEDFKKYGFLYKLREAKYDVTIDIDESYKNA